MSLVINDSPVAYASAHGNLLFTVYNATNVSNPGYKYVCDIYIGGTLVARTKAYPHPTHLRGVFDIGPVVRNYLATQLNPAISLQSQQMGDGEFWLDVICKFGEEYSGTLYTNLLVDSTRRYYNHYNGRLLGVETKLSDFLNKCATNRPYLNSVYTGNYCFIPYFPTSTSAVTVEVKFYTSSGTHDDFSTTITPAAAYKLQLLNVGLPVLDTLFGPLTLSSYEYMTVKVGSTSIYRFDLVCEPKYTPRTIHFLNQYGGFESVVFSKVSRKNIETEKRDFSQLPYRVNSSGVVTYDQSNVLYDTKTVYAARYKERQVFNSDFVSDEGYQWLRELLVSPIVYLEENDYLVPVTIVENTYEEKKRVNDKLTSLSITVEFAQQYNAQFR